MKRTLLIVMGFGILCLRGFPQETDSRFCEPSRIISPLGDLAENGNNAEEARLRKQRLISGLALAGTWAATLVVDLLYDDGYRGTTLIPVVGPFVTIARIEHDNAGYWPGAKPLLIVSGVAQTALATYFVISLVRHPKSDDAKSVTFWPSPNSISVRVQF